MLIAQISDTHIAAPGKRAYGCVDTAAMLKAACAAINGLPLKPDLILATGDLVQTGDSCEYALFREITSCLSAPLYPLAGNHDERSTLKAAFATPELSRQPHPFIQYAIEDYDLRLLVIDTITPGSDEPSLCAARLAWIRARLQEDPRPTLLALHHPPFKSAVAWLEPAAPDWADELADIVGAFPNVVHIVSGHVHRAISARWAGVSATSAPSTAHQVFPDMADGRAPSLSFEAPGFQLHHWRWGTLSTYTVSVPGFADRFAPRS